MANVSFQTTHNVQIDYEAATLGDRIVAALVDYAVFIVYLLFALIFFQIIGLGHLLENGFFILAVMIPVFLYDLVCEVLLNGQNLGKKVMNIRVVKTDGSSPGIGSYLTRWIFRLIDSVLYVWCFGILSILISGKSQRLGDLAAGTTVIRLRRKTRLHNTILHRYIDSGYQPVFSQVSRLTDKDINTIYELVRVIRKTRNSEALQLLTNHVKELMSVRSDMKDIQFLDTVIKDYSNYQFESNKLLKTSDQKGIRA
jgi:uncharacterized RDD family membrane protein YckC